MTHAVAGEPEAVFQSKVVTLARLLRWRVFHTYDSRRSAPGFPDLVLVRKPRIILAELKSASGVLTAEQAGWLDDLRACNGVEVFLWRPADLAGIQVVLR